MKLVLVAAVLVGAGVLVGCEEKKTDNVLDKTKAAASGAMDKTKDAMAGAADKTKDAMAGAADKAKDMGNVVSDKLKGEVKNLMDTVKGKVDQLVKGGDTVKADQKPEFDKAVAGIKSTWADVSSKFDGLSGKTGDGLMTGLNELKTKGTELMTTVKTTAEKFGIKLN